MQLLIMAALWSVPLCNDIVTPPRGLVHPSQFCSEQREDTDREKIQPPRHLTNSLRLFCQKNTLPDIFVSCSLPQRFCFCFVCFSSLLIILLFISNDCSCCKKCKMCCVTFVILLMLKPQTTLPPKLHCFLSLVQMYFSGEEWSWNLRSEEFTETSFWSWLCFHPQFPDTLVLDQSCSYLHD